VNILQSFVRNFIVAYGATSLIHLITSFKTLFTNTSDVLKGFATMKTLAIPLFAGLLPMLYHVRVY
jgi:hypothetical protein